MIAKPLDLPLACEVWLRGGLDLTSFADAVGRAYVAHKSAEYRKSYGLYLIPPPVADFMAGMLAPRLQIKILNPAAGAGISLCAAVKALIQNS